MSWLQDLYETYQQNETNVGKLREKYNGEEYTLLPVAHTTQTAHVEILVDRNGEFLSAHVIEKGKGNTLIPATEDSSNRAGKAVAPYPLHDKLAYVAADYSRYVGVDKSSEHHAYIAQLEEWGNSEFSHPKVTSILTYVKKGKLLEDLVNESILFLDSNERLIEKWDPTYESKIGYKPDIFKVVPSGQEAVFVRFDVYDPGGSDLTRVWSDPEVYSAYMNFYNERLGDYDLCYVTGQSLPSTTKHSNKIRNSGDKAKLISSNDTSGFTFRGRFDSSTEVAAISYEVSQKAHNALKWLLNKQGKLIDNRAFLFWDKAANLLPTPLQDTLDIDALYGKNDSSSGYTNDGFALDVHKAMVGLKKNLSNSTSISILVLDSATTGRMSVQYYRNLHQDHYFSQLENWHTSYCWLHRYRKNLDGKVLQFVGAPSLKDIALAAYGPRANDKLIKSVMERLLPCVIDGRTLPLDIVRSVVQRATSPQAMEKWEWEKTLSIACALIAGRHMNNDSKLKMKGEMIVRIREGETSRDYLFGRLLAVADVLERNALGREENRSTNAIRYMNAFAKNPLRTWGVIQAALVPYQAKLGVKGNYYSKLIDEIASRIPPEEFTNKALSEIHLLGFYSQRYELYQPKNTNKVEEEVQ